MRATSPISSLPARAFWDCRRVTSAAIARRTRPGASPARTPGRRGIAPKLGWVAFDATACLCADDRYVRVVVGFDAQDSAFVRGSHGGGEDAVETAIRVEQAGMQTQA